MQALRLALEGARLSGADIQAVELRDYDLPLLNSPFRHAKGAQHVAKLKNICKKADGIIVATPEYHGSCSGALKNALDWMGFEEFEGKMAGLVGLAGGEMGAFNALSHLRTIFRQVHAWVVPGQVSIARSHHAFDRNGRLLDPKLGRRLKNLGVEVAKFALLHKQGKSNDFLRLWEGCVANPGGEGR